MPSQRCSAIKTAITTGVGGRVHGAPRMRRIGTKPNANPFGGPTTPMQIDEQLCRRILEETQDGIIFADRDGIIRFWNPGAESLFGFGAEETVGQSMDLIIPQRLRDRHWEGWRKSMATGTTRYGRQVLAVPAMRKDGTRISIEFTIVILKDATGAVLGAAAIIRDVTARWEEHRALKQRLAELETKAKAPAA